MILWIRNHVHHLAFSFPHFFRHYPHIFLFNVCKAKKQTNVRSETADIAIQLTPPVRLSLEQSLDFLNDDELLEVTPKNLRLRKRYLSTTERRVKSRNAAKIQE